MYTILPVQIGKGIRSEKDGVGDVGKNVYKEVFQGVAIVGSQGYWSCPLMVHLYIYKYFNDGVQDDG